jgi:hypothetical protein
VYLNILDFPTDFAERKITWFELHDQLNPDPRSNKLSTNERNIVGDLSDVDGSSMKQSNGSIAF